jgi:Flp pilus assembly protein TadD
MMAMARNYAASWMLLHMLLHEDFPYAVEFRRRFEHRNQQQGTGAALDRILLDQLPSELDRDLAAYLNSAIRWRQRHRPAAPPLKELEIRALSESDTLLLWAGLDDFKGAQSSRAQRRLLAAKEAAPGDPEADFWLGRWHARQAGAQAAVEHYKSALQVKPNEPRYLLALAAVYCGGASKDVWPKNEREARLEKVMMALEKTAKTPRQLNAVATYRLVRADYPGATELSRRARESAPDCWECFHTSAAAAFMADDHAQAIQLQKGALSRLPEGTPPEVVEAVEETLRRYRNWNPRAGKARKLPRLVMPE